MNDEVRIAEAFNYTLNVLVDLPDYRSRFLCLASCEAGGSHPSWPEISPALATYPELVTERAAPRPLFGLAPHGVYPASVRYRSRGALLPHLFTLTRLLPAEAGSHQAVLFSVALSVKLALSEPPRPLAGMLPYGDRTFLPPRRVRRDQRLPIRQVRPNYRSF